MGKADNCNSSQQLQQFYAKIVHKCIKKRPSTARKPSTVLMFATVAKVYNSCQGLPRVCVGGGCSWFGAMGKKIGGLLPLVFLLLCNINKRVAHSCQDCCPLLFNVLDCVKGFAKCCPLCKVNNKCGGGFVNVCNNLFAVLTVVLDCFGKLLPRHCFAPCLAVCHFFGFFVVQLCQSLQKLLREVQFFVVGVHFVQLRHLFGC